MKFWLSILLITVICGLVAYIVIYEAGRTQSADGRLDENEVSNTVKTAMALRKAGQAEQAIKVLKKALEKEPDSFLLNVELGRAYEANGDIDLAVSAYEKASEIDPKHHLPYKLLGFLYFNHKQDRAKAEKYLEKSLALNPDQPDVTRFLDTMKGQPVAMPTKPPIPTNPNRHQRPLVPTPTIPDPRPKLPGIPRPGGK